MISMKTIFGVAAALVLTTGLSAQPVELADTPPFAPEGRPLEGLVITVDPGHGGSAHQPGYAGSARGTRSRVVEGDINIQVALLLDHFLRGAGAEVHLTRRDDRKVTLGNTGRADELGSRVDLAEKTASHLFLSIHHNSAARKTADGVVVLIWPTNKAGEEQPLEIAFADLLEEEIKKQVHWTEDFSHYVSEHPLVMDSDIPSATCEFGFLSNKEFDDWVTTPGNLEKEAIGVYRGVVRMWEENREALEAKRAELFPDAGNPQPARDHSVKRDFGAENARLLWPFDRAPETNAEAAFLINAFRRSVMDDRTLFHADVSAEKSDEGFALSGAVDNIWVRNAIADLLRGAGATVSANDIEVLPSDELGDELFGIVQIPMALTWSTPAEGAGVQTQLLLGDEVWLLDELEDGSYLLVHGSEGYVGWVRSEAVRRMAAAEFDSWLNAPKAFLRKKLMADDFTLPMGAGLPVLSVGDDGTTVALRLPMGVRGSNREERIDVSAADLAMPSERPSGRDAALAAVNYLHVPYLFGGRSPQGLDCSGLTGVSYATLGVTLPRDARQQILPGRLVAAPWHLDALQPGDLLFFIGEEGRIVHTAVSLGGDRYIHASPPRVQVNSLDPHDDLYSQHWHEHFAFAKRPLP